MRMLPDLDQHGYLPAGIHRCGVHGTVRKDLARAEKYYEQFLQTPYVDLTPEELAAWAQCASGPGCTTSAENCDGEANIAALEEKIEELERGD